MSDKKLDVGAFVTNRVGHPLGRGVAQGIWKSAWLRQMVLKHPEVARVVSEGFVAFTSLLEFGGDHPIARFANYVSETFATENLELLQEFDKNPKDPEVIAKLEKNAEAAVAKADANDVVIAFDHVHRDEKCVPVAKYIKSCTPPPRTGKGGQVFQNPSTADVVKTSMSAAKAAGIALCGICYPTVSLGKPSAQHEKPAEIVPGRNFLEYVMRLEKDDADAFRDFWETYLERLEKPDGVDLARKFQEAFNGKHSYEAFRFVTNLPDRHEDGFEEWHHALDALLGKVTPASSIRQKIEGFIDEETRQTQEMFRAIWAWIEKGNASRAEKIAAKRKSIAKLDADWKAFREAKPGLLTARNIVIAIFLAILASLYLMKRAETPNTRSDISEQKVETVNER